MQLRLLWIVYSCPCIVLDAILSRQLRSTFDSRRKNGVTHLSLGENYCGSPFRLRWLDRFFASIHLTACFSKSLALGPARYGIGWAVHCLESSKSMQCFAMLIRSKQPSHMVLNFSNILINLCRYRVNSQTVFLTSFQSRLDASSSTFITFPRRPIGNSRHSESLYTEIVFMSPGPSLITYNSRIIGLIIHPCGPGPTIFLSSLEILVGAFWKLETRL